MNPFADLESEDYDDRPLSVRRRDAARSRPTAGPLPAIALGVSICAAAVAVGGFFAPLLFVYQWAFFAAVLSLAAFAAAVASWWGEAGATFTSCVAIAFSFVSLILAAFLAFSANESWHQIRQSI